MKKFEEIKSVAAYIDRKNIDTDAIIPKQYLKSVTREGFGETLFDDWRYLEPGNLGDNHSLRKKNPDFISLCFYLLQSLSQYTLNPTYQFVELFYRYPI